MQPDGVGALYLAYEALKAKLYAEGLFDERYKKPLPKFPTKIGVITSPTGAAIRDVIHVLSRRFPSATVYLYPALVQGDGAEQSLIAGLDYFETSGLADVIIIGRGGGSIEDLWAFNGEALARKIFSLSTPVISAVGHETDFTICDFVSDRRAPTPSAAAEIAVPDTRELLLMLDGVYERAAAAVNSKLSSASLELDFSAKNPIIAKGRLFDDKEEELLAFAQKIGLLTDTRLASADTALRVAAGKLDSLSPLAVLRRGYSVVSANGRVITDGECVSSGDLLDIRLSKGRISAKVIGKGNKDE
jgi:exodeoxyribonuclease VII large subunit